MVVGAGCQQDEEGVKEKHNEWSANASDPNSTRRSSSYLYYYYSYPQGNLLSSTDQISMNKMVISKILQRYLKWFPRQVDELFEKWPDLAMYPMVELEDRIR